MNITTTAQLEIAQSIELLGFVVVEGVVDDEWTGRLIAAIEAVGYRDFRFEISDFRMRRRAGFAIRDLLVNVPVVREVAGLPAVRGLVEGVLGSGARVVRGILFDKPAEANWKVAWHQDLTIEVGERIDVPGFGPWSVKGGVAHVQPPVSVLEQMLAVRIHLDDSTAENGPLRVIPASHREGRLTVEQMLALRERNGEVALTVARGGVILMRPLLAHASSAAERPTNRRVVHLEFAAEELPGGLRWRTSTCSPIDDSIVGSGRS